MTNGTLLTRDTVKKLALNCSGVNFNISIDGSTPDKLDILRHRKRRSSDKRLLLFNQVTAGAKAISDAGLSLGVSFVVSGMNADYLENVYDMAINELGASSVTAIHFFPAGFEKAALSELALEYVIWKKLILDLTRRHHSFRKLNIAVSASWEIYLPLLNSGFTPQQVCGNLAIPFNAV